MSSTERAPEPTMEEILASIRRIITDDEASQAQPQNASPKAEAEDESLEGDSDNQIIDDIARVLGGDAAEAPASEDEEILDLTAELGGLEIIEDEGDAPLEPQFEQPPQAEAVVLTSPEAEEPAPEPVAETQPQEDAPPAPPSVEPVQSAGEEAASALERAIAALRAGQSLASTKPQTQPSEVQATPQPDTTPAGAEEPETIPMAVPMASPEAETETHPEPEPVVEPDAELNFEAQPEIAPTIEPMIEEAMIEEHLAEDQPADELMPTDAEFTFLEEPAEAESEEKRPFWPVQDEVRAHADEPATQPEPAFAPESETEAAPLNGAEAHHDVAGKTLEDSIKDMLRPMLRQWLDENMPRMIREGFDPETLRRGQD